MAKRKNALWVIEFTSPDPSSESTNAYHTRKEAIDHACAWIKYNAEQDLESIGWGDDDEAPKLLRQALDAIKAKRFASAVWAWLEYQNEYDPSEKIAIGPSGYVSDRASDWS